MMSEHFDEHEIEDALDAALRISTSIKNADGYDEIASAIAHRYAERSDFDRAIRVADTLKDPYAMDKTVGEIAVVSFAAGYETEAFELIESIEDFSHKATATSQIAVAHASAGQIDRALEIASTMDDNAVTMAEIARQCAAQSEFDRAIEIVDMLEIPIYASWARMHIAESYAKSGRGDEALEMLLLALEDADQIDASDEKATTLAEIAVRIAEAGRQEQADEVLARALQEATKTDELYRDTALSQIALSHARIGQYDRALAIAEKIDDIYQVTATLVSLAVKEHENDSRQAEALQLLSDAFDLIKEDVPQTQRNEAQHNNLLTLIAVRYADFGKRDNATSAAQSIGAENERDLALSNVALRFAQAGAYDEALVVARAISNVNSRAGALVSSGRAAIAADAIEQGVEMISEANGLIETLERLSDKVQLKMELVTAYKEAGRMESVASLFGHALIDTKSISGEYQKAATMLSIADACAKTEFEFDDAGLDMLWEIAAR